MRMTIRVAFAVLTLLLISNGLAQQQSEPGERPLRRGGEINESPADRGPRRDGPEGRARENRGRRQEGRPLSPLMEVLDTDRNGKLSASEIAAASQKLGSLDKDNDGELSEDELRPAPPQRGGRGDRAGGEPPPRRAPGRGDADGGRRRRGPPPAGPRPFNSIVYAERILSFDQNGDSLIARDELPQRMESLIDLADTNGDGSLDQSELEDFAKSAVETRDED